LSNFNISIGIPFVGVLCIGLILTQEGPKVIDFDVRFGDPEIQSLLPLLRTDLAEIMLACIEQRLDEVEITLKEKFCVAVVHSAEGYPGPVKVGKSIQFDMMAAPDGKPKRVIGAIVFLISYTDVFIFHGGTTKVDGQLCSTRGRVLTVSATGISLEEASALAYEYSQLVHFDESYYRTDIGKL
jgi:phosphoribosylamine--glycine ligase / phosphoribosylformylglycinamidine cyclo-ligase